jgi:hypothetical protein
LDGDGSAVIVYDLEIPVRADMPLKCPCSCEGGGLLLGMAGEELVDHVVLRVSVFADLVAELTLSSEPALEALDVLTVFGMSDDLELGPVRYLG